MSQQLSFIDGTTATRRCTLCKQMKPAVDFIRKDKQRTRSDCYDCHRHRRQLYKQKTKKGRKRRIVDYFGRSCQDCGFVSQCDAVYDFHHVHPTNKTRLPGSALRQSYNRFFAEAANGNLVMLCANCHRIRHHAERSIGKQQTMLNSLKT